MMRKKGRARWGTVIVAVLLIGGLGLFTKTYLSSKSDASPAPVAAEPQAPAVVVQLLEQADLAIAREYIGRIEPIQTVSIRPQVAGEIAQVHFTEGSMVKEGDLLFTLDSKQYQATVDLRKADQTKAEANLQHATKYYNRLKASDKRSVSASDLESAENDVNQSRAAVAQAKASLRLAQIDLGYTKITAPITGRIGRAEYTKGNYVTPSVGQLASIVQVDPIRVSFSMPDRDYLEQIEAFKGSDKPVYNATITLPDGEVYAYAGERDYEDNVMNNRTGTITVTMRYKNDKGVLVPGTMVRVMTKPVETRVATVVPMEAVMADSEGDYVYLVDESNTVQQRRIKTGAEVGYMNEVLSGVEPGEKVIIRGLQSVRPNMKVKPSFLKAANEALTPAERAMESGYDLKTVVPVTSLSKGDTPKKES